MRRAALPLRTMTRALHSGQSRVCLTTPSGHTEGERYDSKPFYYWDLSKISKKKTKKKPPLCCVSQCSVCVMLYSDESDMCRTMQWKRGYRSDPWPLDALTPGPHAQQPVGPSKADAGHEAKRRWPLCLPTSCASVYCGISCEENQTLSPLLEL